MLRGVVAGKRVMLLPRLDSDALPDGRATAPLGELPVCFPLASAAASGEASTRKGGLPLLPVWVCLDCRPEASRRALQ